MKPRSRIPSSFAARFVFSAAMFGCASTPPSVPAAVTSVATEPPPDGGAPAPIERAKPDIVRVGAGEAVVVAPGQIVEGEWFRVAVFGDKACGNSLGGGTLHAIDFFYDNLTPELTRFFSKSATIELVNARGESFGVFGGPLVGEGCGPGLSLADGAQPGARLRGRPFAGLPAGVDPPTHVRLLLEEPHGFAVSTVTVDLGLSPKPPGPLPAPMDVTDLLSTSAGTPAGSSTYFELVAEGLRSCTHQPDPWIDRVFAEGKAEGKSMRVVGLDLRLENRSSEAIALTAMEAVDADGHGYSVYPTTNTSCELGRFPKQIEPRASGKGTAAFALVPAGTRGLSVSVEVRPVGKSHYDGYRPVNVRVPLGDVGR
jgi:hypothetical protein